MQDLLKSTATGIATKCTVTEVSEECGVSRALARTFLENSFIEKSGNSYILPFSMKKIKNRFKTWLDKYNRTLALPLLEKGYVRLYDNDITKYTKKFGYSCRTSFSAELNRLNAKKYFINGERISTDFNSKLHTSAVVVADIKKEDLEKLQNRKRCKKGVTPVKKEMVSVKKIPNTKSVLIKDLLNIIGINRKDISSSAYNTIAAAIKSYAVANNIEMQYLKNENGGHRVCSYIMAEANIKELTEKLAKYKTVKTFEVKETPEVKEKITKVKENIKKAEVKEKVVAKEEVKAEVKKEVKAEQKMNINVLLVPIYLTLVMQILNLVLNIIH